MNPLFTLKIWRLSQRKPSIAPYTLSITADSIRRKNQRKALFTRASDELAAAWQATRTWLKSARLMIASHAACVVVALGIGYVLSVQPAQDAAEREKHAAIERAKIDADLIAHWHDQAMNRTATLTLTGESHTIHRAALAAGKALEQPK